MPEKTEQKKSVRVDYRFGKAVSIHDLKALQGDLKTLSDENYKKLRNEILETGFAFAPHVWKDKNGKYWLVDGHQRTEALRRMENEGLGVPKIPIVEVQAKSLNEAKVRVLQGISQYGDMNLGFLDEFLPKDLKMEDVDLRFEIPEFHFSDKDPEDAVGSIEINESDISGTLVHTCPKCGFSFGKQK